MSDDQTPVAIWSGTFRVFDVDLRCSVLDDGRRVIDADDVAKLFASMDDGASRTEADHDAFETFARWYRGR